MPEDAKPNTPEGATAFARWYVEQSSQATVDWDAGVLEAYSDPGCATCTEMIQIIREWKDGGYRTPFRRYQFESSQVGPGNSPEIYLVDLKGKDLASQVLGPGGGVVREEPESESLVRVTVRRLKESWSVQRIQGIKK